MTKIEQIYTDYIKSRVLGESVKSVALKHNCIPRYVYYAVNVIEDKHVYKQSTNIRFQTWEYKYKRIMETKPSKDLVRKLVRYLYVEKGFDIEEIAKYIGISPNSVIVTVWG